MQSVRQVHSEGVCKLRAAEKQTLPQRFRTHGRSMDSFYQSERQTERPT